MKILLTLVLLLTIGYIWHDTFFVFDKYVYIRRWDLERKAMTAYKERGVYDITESWLWINCYSSDNYEDCRIYSRLTTPKPGDSLFDPKELEGEK